MQREYCIPNLIFPNYRQFAGFFDKYCTGSSCTNTRAWDADLLTVPISRKLANSPLYSFKEKSPENQT